MPVCRIRLMRVLPGERFGQADLRKIAGSKLRVALLAESCDLPKGHVWTPAGEIEPRAQFIPSAAGGIGAVIGFGCNSSGT